MALDINKLVNWFVSHRGKLTYSMLGSRNGSDGTADCSGSVSQALKEAGIPIQGLPSTVTLGAQLERNRFKRITVNGTWDSRKGDIVLMSWGAGMAQSGGAGGHVGVMLDDNNNFISCDYSTQGQAGTAISTHNINNYLSGVPYYEVWRYDGALEANPLPAPKTPKFAGKAYYQANAVEFQHGIWQIKCDYLVPTEFNWLENGIPVAMVNWVDKDGNNITDGKDEDFKAGMYFSFEIDEQRIRDTGEGGYNYGYYWRQFEFGQYGPVWLSTWNKDDLVNYYE